MTTICVELVNTSKSLLNVSLVDQFGLPNTLQLLTYREMLRLSQKTGSSLYLAIDLITTFFFLFLFYEKRKKNSSEKHSITHSQTEITDVHLNYIHNMLLYTQSVSRQYINILKSVFVCFKNHVLKHVALATEILLMSTCRPLVFKRHFTVNGDISSTK